MHVCSYFLPKYIILSIMVKPSCVVQFCSNSNQTGYTMHKFSKFSFRFGAAVGKICSSEKSRIRKANGPLFCVPNKSPGLLQEMFFRKRL